MVWYNIYMIDTDKTNNMTAAEKLIRTEVKSMVAKLLAREDITIQRGNYETASFDVKNRVLQLPLWDGISNDVLDLFIGHEISHALHTPENGIDAFLKRFKNVPFSLCNIVEDVRIERLVQKEYPGLIRSFTNGYKDLYDRDFFKLDETPISERGFVDRLNIKAKLRKLVDVEFSDEEQKLVDLVYAAETYEDVLDACEEIIKFVDENEKPEDEDNNESSDSSDDSNDDSSEETESTSSNDDSDSEETDNSQGDFMSTDDDESTDLSNYDDDWSDDGEEAETEESKPTPGRYASDSDEALNDSMKDTRVSNGDDDHWNCNSVHNFVDATKEMINHTIFTYDELEKSRDEWTGYGSEKKSEYADDYLEFKRTTKKYVAALKREFDMKKAAYQYSRATVSKTGKLDVNKIHSYKYSEDIFNSVTTLANAKNHGMLFYIDMSGSMSYNIGTIYKQAINLAMFCQGVGIPFEVYGFTSGNRRDVNFEAPNCTFSRMDDLQMIQLLSSDLKGAKFNKACKDMYVASRMLDCHDTPSNLEGLGGTPMSEAIIVSTHIAKDFIARHKPQNVTTMWLTDGEGFGLGMSERGSKFIGKIAGGKQITISDTRHKHVTPVLFDNYRAVTGSNVIHFFLTNCKEDVRQQYWYVTNDEWKQYRTENIFMRDGECGFDRSFILKAANRRYDENNLDSDTSFGDVDTRELSDSALKNAFIKHNKKNKGQRIFVNKFVEMVA